MFPLCTFLMFSTGTENKKVTLGSNGLILLNWDLIAIKVPKIAVQLY